jgi:shikimate kinase
VNLILKRTPGIFLVGFMGSGKSTVGRMLAERLGWRFVDLDVQIESEQGVSISEIFSSRGEEQFRGIETAALRGCIKKIQTGQPTIVALGGGAFTRPENIELLSGNGISIWIDTDFTIMRRRVQGATHRPLARDPEMFESLFRTRRESYGRADYRVSVEKDDSTVAVDRILNLPIWE